MSQVAFYILRQVDLRDFLISGISDTCITFSSNTLTLGGVAVIRAADFYKPSLSF